MTIRYQCDSCGSKLNIRDELAGTAGKCPKCKTAFAVPAADATADVASPSADKTDRAETDRGKPAPRPAASAGAPAATKRPAKAKMPSKAVAARDEDFDPVAFLMEEEPATSDGQSAPPLSDDEIPVALELDLSDEEPPRRRGRSRRRVNLEADEDVAFGSASASADAMLSGGASAGAARDLLTRTVEESRARASRLDDKKPREPSVAFEIARELFVRGLPGLVGIAILGIGIYLVMNSMLGDSMDLPPLGRVSGRVALDGDALAGASITFLPVKREFELSENKTIGIRASRAVTDADGNYTLEYMEGIPGAFVGQHRVSISKRDGPRELAPARYGPYSSELRAVGPDSQVFNFDLKSDEQP